MSLKETLAACGQNYPLRLKSDEFNLLLQKLRTATTDFNLSEYLLYGISCLQTFVLINWTGFKERIDLKLDFDERCLIPEDGESFEEPVKNLALLHVAKLILFNAAAENDDDFALNWWKFRYLSILQRCLTEKSERIHDETVRIIAKIEIPETDSRLRVLFDLETAQFYATYYEVSKVKGKMTACLELLGMKIEETGAMGKRTKFQERDLAQFAIKLDSNQSSQETTPIPQDEDCPKDLILDDEIRLDKIKFREDPNSRIPTVLEQLILLCAFTLKRKSRPTDELTQEELSPYLDLILRSRSNWAVIATALLFRSRMESKNRRTVERAMMQIQTLVDSVKSPDSDEVKLSRLDYVYSSRLPPSWELELELCSSLMSMGSVKAALDVALGVQAWEQVIHCYHQLQLRHKAAEVIRERISKKATPLLYCMLGDATDQVEHYHKALELADGRSSRAYRSLGIYYYFRKEYEKAVEFFNKSVELNGYQPSTLLRLGFAATQLQDWNLAAKTYRKYCSYESDNFEAWNNLSNAYIKLGQKARAWKVLQEAVKCDYDNWKIWDNVMVISTDLAHFEEVIRAYNRILDLKEKHVDLEVLSILVKAVTENVLDNLERPSAPLKGKTLTLLGRLTSQVSTEGKLWELYSDLSEGDPIKMCAYMQKAHACLTQKSGWERDCAKSKEVLRMALKYARKAAELKHYNNKAQSIQLMSSAKLSLKSTTSRVKQGQTSVASGEIVAELLDSYNELVKSIQDIANIIQELK